MKLLDDVKAFLLRKRALPIVLGCLALALVGHFMEAHEVGFGDLARSGAKLTRSIYHTLDQQQPGDMLGRYGEAMYGGTASCARDCGPHNIVSLAFTAVKVTPRVAAESWRTGSWFTRALLVATIGFVILLLWGGITDRGESVGQRLATLPFMFVLGSVLVALVFWLALHLLMLLTFLIGEILSGIVVVIGTFGGIWKIGKIGVETLKRADEIEDKGVPFVKKLFGIGTPPPASGSPPPSPPPPAPPAVPPGHGG